MAHVRASICCALAAGLAGHVDHALADLRRRHAFPAHHVDEEGAIQRGEERARDPPSCSDERDDALRDHAR